MSRIGCTALALFLWFLPCMGMGTAAQTTVELLEQGIYTEQTVGDLDAAIEIYTRIVSDAQAERSYVAQALYRLGQCWLKTGKKDRATGTFEKLVAEYPDQAELVAQARQHLPAEKPPAGALDIRPAPWEDGEHLRFVLKTPAGKPVGDLTYSVSSVDVKGRAAWRVESYLGLPKHEIAKYMYVEADRKSFRPINTMLHHTQLGTLRAHFTKNERQMKMSRPGDKPEGYNQKLVGETYDNEQAIFLVRRLPLAEGYETSFALTGRPGVTAMAGLRVAGVETVTVPAGTFECFKTELGTPPRVETYWISTNSNRYLVKVVNAELHVELTEITRLHDGPPVFEDEEAGFSLSAPRGWDIMRSSFRFQEHGVWLLLFSPELKAKAVMVSQKPESPLSVREFADQDIEIYKGRRSTFSVREESWMELEVAGASAVSMLADLEADGAKMVEYRIYVEGPSAFYFFVFRTEPDDFDTMKDEFDSIAHSLRLG